MARTPVLSSGGNPFGVSNPGFSYFDLGGENPAQKALSDASEHRYEIGLRWSNGQATDAEYLAAIAAERAAAALIATSTDSSVSDPAKHQMVQLDNLVHDVNRQIGENNARAQGDEALLAFWQQTLAGMTPGSTAYVSLQKQIQNLADSISNQHDIDNSKAAALAMQQAQSDWQAGLLDDAGYKVALQKYADAQKPDSTEWINAHDLVKSETYRLDRDALVALVDDNKKPLEDLLAFDAAHLKGLDPNSAAGRQAEDTFQQTQYAVYARDEAAIVKQFNDGLLTAVQAKAWYDNTSRSGVYAGNAKVLESITTRRADFADRVQGAMDTATTQRWNDGTLKTSDYMAYAKTRQADYAPGTQQYMAWGAEYVKARDKQVEVDLSARWTLSDKQLTLEKYISDNSTPPKGAKSETTRQVLNADGHTFRTVTDVKYGDPTPEEIEAWNKTQIAVADAKRQLVDVKNQLKTAGGFVAPLDMANYYRGLQAKTIKGTPEWTRLQDQINSYTDRDHYWSVVSQQGVKVGYPTVATAAGNGGGGGARPGASVPTGAAAMPSTVVGTGSAPMTVPKGAAVPPKGARFGGMKGGGYTAAELDYVAIRMSQLTGLDPRVTRIWALKESGGGNNPFGAGLVNGHRVNYSSIEEGIQTAANWVNTHGNMRGIKNSVGKSPAEQLRAIDSSPWGPNGYNGGYRGSLLSLANQQGLRAPGSVALSNGTATTASPAAAHVPSVTGKVPTAKPPPPPTTSISVPAGQGAPSGLRQITGVKQHDPTHPGAYLIPATQAFDFPQNLDGDAFQRLYNPMVTAYLKGESSFTYNDPSSPKPITISIPATAEDRLKFITQLDNTNINLWATRATTDSRTDFTTDGNYQRAVIQAGQNQLSLLSMNTPGGQPGVKPLPSKKKPTTEEAATTARVRQAGEAPGDLARYTGIQTNSLTPLSAIDRITNQQVTFINTMTKRAKAEFEAGHIDQGYAILNQIYSVASSHSTWGMDSAGNLVQTGRASPQEAQLLSYINQGKTKISAIEKKYPGTDVSQNTAVTSDLAAFASHATTIGSALGPANDLKTKYVDPNVKTYPVTDADTGEVMAVPVFSNITIADPRTGQPRNVTQLQIKPGRVAVADRTSDGDVKVEYVDMDSDYTDGVPTFKDPTRVLATIPDGRGGFTEAWVKWESGIIGTIRGPGGKTYNVYGRKELLSTGGEQWVENPFNPGQWVKGPIKLEAPKDFSVFNTVDKTTGLATDQLTFTFSSPAFAQALKDAGANPTARIDMVFDPKTGQYHFVTVVPDPEKPNGLIKVDIGSVSSGNNADAMHGAGFGLDWMGMTGDQRTILSLPSKGPYPGASTRDVVSQQTGDRTHRFDDQTAEQVRDRFGSVIPGITSATAGAGAGAGAAPFQIGPVGFGSSDGGYIGGRAVGGYWGEPPSTLAGGGAEAVASLGGWAPLPEGGRRGNMVPVVGSAGYIAPPPSQPVAARGVGITGGPGGNYVPTTAPAWTATPAPAIRSGDIGVGGGPAAQQPRTGVSASASLPPASSSKAPTVTKPATKPSPSVGAGAGASGTTGNVQATASLPKITPPPKVAPKPAPVPPPPVIKSGPNKQY